MRMIEDMKLAGLSPGTQATYIDAVRKLAAYYPNYGSLCVFRLMRITHYRGYDPRSRPVSPSPGG
jgi:hypothetical protein